MKETIKNHNTYPLRLLLITLLFTFLSACGGIPPGADPPTVNSFTADPPIINEEENAILSWNVTDATTVSITPGIGAVAISGSTSVYPTTTITYILIASNGAGSNSATVTVTVNPSVIEQNMIIQPGPEEGKDSSVQSKYSGANFGTSTYAMIGNDFGPPIARTYLQFDLSTLPNNINITAANLMVYQYHYFYPLNFDIAIHRVTSIWEENAITWDNQPNYNLLSEDHISVTNADDDTWISWNITDLVQGWMEGSFPNYGVVLKDTDEDLVDQHIRCWTSDYTDDPSLRPKLEIKYYIP